MPHIIPATTDDTEPGLRPARVGRRWASRVTPTSCGTRLVGTHPRLTREQSTHDLV